MYILLTIGLTTMVVCGILAAAGMNRAEDAVGFALFLFAASLCLIVLVAVYNSGYVNGRQAVKTTAPAAAGLEPASSPSDDVKPPREQ